MKYSTWVNVEKVKDIETGGKHTSLNDPVVFNFNSGTGFMVNGIDPLKPFRPKHSNQFPKQPEQIIDKDGQSALNWGGGLMSASEKIRSNENPF